MMDALKSSRIICADDYGFNQPISDGILQLIQAKKIQATSCMTNMPYWSEAAKKLINTQAQVGLHFNLTDGQALTPACQKYFSSLSKLMMRAFGRCINASIIEAELRAQLERFKKHMGCLPDFIDGHQHVHQLPVIRSVLLKVYAEYFPDNNVWLRVSSNSLLKSIKQSLRCPKILIISLTGALTLRRQLQRRQIPFNTSFSGIYDLSPERDYEKIFQQFLKEINQDGLIMCHPGLKSDDAEDPIAKARVNELEFYTQY